MHYKDIVDKKFKKFIDVRRKAYNSVFKKNETFFVVVKIVGEEVAIAEVQKGSYVIVFDGSNSSKEWKSNSKTIKQQSNDVNDNKQVLFHSGFYKTFIKIIKALKIILDIKNAKAFDIVGYSRGAIFALLLYRFLKKYHKDIPISGIGFGMPSCMNEQASFDCCTNNYTSGFVSVEHYQDIVTKILNNWMGYVKTPCKRVMIGSRWAKFFSWIPRISPHMKYFERGSYE